jgi:hypothetical protein
LVAVTHGQHIGRAVRNENARALHNRFGVVGDRMLEALELGRDAQRRGVVVGAVVDPGDPFAAGVDHACDESSTVGGQDGLGSLHLDLEMQRAGLEWSPSGA